MQSLVQISNGLRELVARVGSSVVNVRGRRGCGASGIVWSRNLILTSARAFEREDELSVQAGAEAFTAEVVGSHPTSDLLLLRISGELTPFSPGAGAEAGELVLLLSRPSERIRARLGLVSVTGGEWRLPGGARMERYIETDILPSPALASSALVGMDGTLLGVNHPGLARGALVTLPASSVADVVAQLSTHGRIRRGHLGVMVQPVRLPTALAEELRRNVGLIALSVRDGSPAERGGILLGDVLLELGGQALTRAEELEAGLGVASIDREIELRLLRSGALQTVRVTPEERS